MSTRPAEEDRPDVFDMYSGLWFKGPPEPRPPPDPATPPRLFREVQNPQRLASICVAALGISYVLVIIGMLIGIRL